MRGREGWLEIPILLGIWRGMRTDRNVIDKTKQKKMPYLAKWLRGSTTRD
jgi:hypothetical protein